METRSNQRRKTETAIDDSRGRPVQLLYDETNDKTIMARGTALGATEVDVTGGTIDEVIQSNTYFYDEINSIWTLSELDPASGAQTTIEEEHHKVHVGMHFFVKSFQDLANGNILDVIIETDASDWYPHLLWHIQTESEVLFQLYEGATITNAGTSKTAFNNDRDSSNAATAAVTYHVNTSLANANADTPVAGATLLADGLVGAGKDAGQNVRTSELMFKPSTIYVLRFTANAAGYVDYDLNWYEHEAHIHPHGL